MKKIIFYIITLVLLNSSLFISNSNAQWVVNYSDTSFYLTDILFTSPNTGWVSGYKYFISGLTEGRLLKTTNGGSNWILQSIGAIPGIWGLNFIDQNTGWFVGDKGLVKKTTNGGINWFSQNIDTTQYAERVNFLNSLTGWITGFYLYKTTDGGNNWIKNSGAPASTLDINFLNESTGFVSSYYSHINKTTNSGLTWIDVYAGQFHTFIYDIGFLNNDVGWAVGEADLDGVLKTTNGGNNWTRIYSDNSELRTIYFKDINTGWTGGWSKIMKTTNSGQNWSIQLNSSLDWGYITKISKSNDSTLWAAGSKGTIFKTTNGGVGINQISTEIPSSFSLSQNYPNPFNSMCNVQFSMCNAGNVKLVVYDVRGREVQTLVNEMLKPGTYEVTFDGSMLNSGIYFYKLTINGFTETKKMLMIK